MLHSLTGPAIVLCIILVIGADTARADIRLDGDRKNIRIEIQNVSLSDVLTQLAERYGFTFQSSVPLNRIVSGNYSGSLKVVLDRLLEKNNYMTKHTGSQLAIMVYGTTNAPLNTNSDGDPVGPQNAGKPLPASASSTRVISNPARAKDNGYVR